MIKVDIVNEVSKIADITKVKAEVAVDAVFDAMRTSMQRGERIEPYNNHAQYHRPSHGSHAPHGRSQPGHGARAIARCHA